MAKDVSAFLVWTAEPKLENRRRAGFAVVIFLLLGTILGYFAYRQIWAEAKRKVRVTGPLEAESQVKAQAAKDDQGIAG
jgi:ubiquinol-cytochrome c reductase cytochrome c1 subunit